MALILSAHRRSRISASASQNETAVLWGYHGRPREAASPSPWREMRSNQMTPHIRCENAPARSGPLRFQLCGSSAPRHCFTFRKASSTGHRSANAAIVPLSASEASAEKKKASFSAPFGSRGMTRRPGRFETHAHITANERVNRLFFPSAPPFPPASIRSLVQPAPLESAGGRLSRADDHAGREAVAGADRIWPRSPVSYNTPYPYMVHKLQKKAILQGFVRIPEKWA